MTHVRRIVLAAAAALVLFTAPQEASARGRRHHHRHAHGMCPRGMLYRPSVGVCAFSLARIAFRAPPRVIYRTKIVYLPRPSPKPPSWAGKIDFNAVARLR